MKKMKEFILREVADEYILIPTGKTTEEFNGIISLTETAAYIYNHIEEADSFEALINMITSEYDVDKETAAKDAYVFINHMICHRPRRPHRPREELVMPEPRFGFYFAQKKRDGEPSQCH